MTVKFAKIAHDRTGEISLQFETAEVHQVPTPAKPVWFLVACEVLVACCGFS
jgi:hypothetical protein